MSDELPPERASSGAVPRPSRPDFPLEPPPTPAEVLWHAEAVRARAFYRVLLVLVALVLGFLPVLPIDASLRAPVAVGLGVEGVVVAWALVRLRDLDAYTPRLAVFVGAVSGVIGVGVIFAIGIFSAAVMALNLGVYFFGLSQSRSAARATFAVIATAYLALSGALALGLAPDLGLFSAEHAAAASRYYQVLASQVVFGATFWLARSSRRATSDAVERAWRESLATDRRERQLADARRELERALRPSEGRHTGEKIGGYALDEVVGRGAMGEVYAATHVESRRRVAIKLLHPNLLEDPKIVQRFLREARAESSAKSDHVAEMLELGVAASGAPYLVMELLVGHDLGWHLRQEDKLPLARVVELVEQIARGLSAVRDAGIVHRDLKPANLFLTEGTAPRWKVLDFGLSKIAGATQLTRDVALGTPHYMAPEQVKGSSTVDHLADQYALAAIAYAALTGVAPFGGENVANVLYDVLYTQPPSPAQFVKIPVDVELVLAVGMAKKKDDRFAFVEELAGALRLAAEGELDDETRRRGWSVLKKRPWGSSRAPVRKVA